MTYPQHIYYSIRGYLIRLCGVGYLFYKALLNQAMPQPAQIAWEKIGEENGKTLWMTKVMVLTKNKEETT